MENWKEIKKNDVEMSLSHLLLKYGKRTEHYRAKSETNRDQPLSFLLIMQITYQQNKNHHRFILLTVYIKDNIQLSDYKGKSYNSNEKEQKKNRN